MNDVGEQLRRYVTAISDPTRGMILMELDHAGELTATQLARRLGLSSNNVYHHMRVLRRLDVVDPPRAVASDTYVEKYYRIKPEIGSILQLDPDWLDPTQASMTADDRKAILVSVCLTMAHLLRQAAHRYQEMDAEMLDNLAHTQQLAMVSINEVGRERLRDRLAALREVLVREQEQFSDDLSPRTDVVFMAALPTLWDEPG